MYNIIGTVICVIDYTNWQGGCIMIFLFVIFSFPVLVGIGVAVYAVVSDYICDKIHTSQHVHDPIFDGITADYIDDIDDLDNP